MTPKSIDLEGSIIDLGMAQDNHGDIVQMSSLVFWVRSEADIRAEEETAKRDEAQDLLARIRQTLAHFGGRASRNDVIARMRDLGMGEPVIKKPCIGEPARTALARA